MIFDPQKTSLTRAGDSINLNFAFTLEDKPTFLLFDEIKIPSAFNLLAILILSIT
jgi:hypothetical protein